MDRRNFLRFGLAAAATAGLPLAVQATPKGLSIEEALRNSWDQTPLAFAANGEPVQTVDGEVVSVVEMDGSLICNTKWTWMASRTQIPELRLAIQQAVKMLTQWLPEHQKSYWPALVLGGDRYLVDLHTMNCTLVCQQTPIS